MPVIKGFIGSSYVSEDVSQNAQRCVNWSLEQDPTGKLPAYFVSAPGLRRLAIVGNGPIRAAEAVGGDWLIVSGDRLYHVVGDFSTSALLLTMQTSSGSVFIAQAGKSALVVDGVAGYGVDTVAWTAAQVTAEGFPVSPATCTSLDGYFITHTAGSQSYQISAPFDPQTWNAADVAAKEGANDPIARVIAAYRQLHLIGTATSEIWQDSGSADFPFVRIDGAFVEQGTPAAATVRDIDGAVLWLGQSKVGKAMVWRMQDFSPVRISTHAIERALSSYARLDDAYAWVYQDRGHAFYVLSVPSAGATWCFDITTQLWHERPYRNADSGALEAHRGACHAFGNGTHLVGDRVDGRLFALDPETFDDDGDPMLSLRASPHLWNGGARSFLAELEFFFAAGVGLPYGQGSVPTVMLRVSKDGGHTWPIQRSTSIGAIGEYRRRARFCKITNARDLVIEISITDPVKRVLTGASARAV